MDKSDAILATVALAGTPLHGRTTLQKLAYFESEAGLFPARFKPHYYGPYSQEVANTVEELVSLGYLQETVTLLGEQQESWLAALSGGVKIYSYELTREGRELTERLMKSDPSGWKKLDNLVKSIKKHSRLSPGVLAMAAKVHFALKGIDRKSVTIDQLVGEAEKYNWKLTEGQIRSAAELLLNVTP